MQLLVAPPSIALFLTSFTKGGVMRLRGGYLASPGATLVLLSSGGDLAVTRTSSRQQRVTRLLETNLKGGGDSL